MNYTNKKNIVIYGGGWSHNIGNAFLQLGSIESVRNSCPDANIYLVNSNNVTVPPSIKMKIILKAINKLPRSLRGVFASYWLKSHKQQTERTHKNSLRIADFLLADYVLISGSWLAEQYLNSGSIHLDIFKKFMKNGAKLVFNGVSGFTYEDKEISAVRSTLEMIKPHALIARDKKAFELYKDYFERSYDGIDAAFFLNDCFQPPQFAKSGYKIYCFDKMKIPSELKMNDNAIITHHSFYGLKQDPFVHPNTFFSETPDDYLALYAHCGEIHSDRVHACLPVLLFGGKAQMHYDAPRAELFKQVGCEGITERLVSLDRNILKDKKLKQIDFLSKLLT
ncbi:MAG: hypothetical protein COV30_01345 [Candidatus Yanofskybacteria bacterium CG10_big_fil_rev_8_21_14_0_10_37_15]|uniref:Polysaccharide pyruvyl transferase domain-containing protein n=1 Tax=Candidatus Yanofskybacteria bacterium CG10_big_fil_rev_8_21_14_0_10_37_15 TaxID=1975097 RepID=A0A2H0R5L8_9BACT|nr:MAG: hypothetical protein COV30_01345 [Candidatus Yanofskybacteria bacterium CG10_big_fil_rev_8_21_14_0_10_37_15]